MKFSEYQYDEIIPPKEYQEIWDEVNLPTQIDKARRNGVSEIDAKKIFKSLSKRGYYLATVAKYFNCKNIAEVGTAKGYQLYSFGEYCKNNEGHVFSCDIRNQKNEEYMNKYRDYCTFIKGNSKNLASYLVEQNVKIDLFYIDGAHHAGSVLKDVAKLASLQSESPVWVFDDYDKRFGCYKDISSILKKDLPHHVYFTGNTASGLPNHQVIIHGQ